jgi:hypothetical protein
VIVLLTARHAHDTHTTRRTLYGQGWETLATNQLHFIGLVQRMLRDDLRYYKAINRPHGTE